MAKYFLSEYLIDTGGLDLLLDPPDDSVADFWNVFARKKQQHSVSEVVYWEFLRQYGPNCSDVRRQRFVRAIDKESILILPFDRGAADVAVRIFHGVRSRLLGAKTERRARMNELQCDIMIAAVAVRNGKIVVTDDFDDWGLLRTVVQQERLGTMPLLSKEDMRDPKKWKGK